MTMGRLGYIRFVGLGILGGAALCLSGVPAKATIITYDVANIVGNTFEYTYTVQNDTLGADIAEFAVYFNVALFENLSAPGAPAGWDPLIIQPDATLPDDGFYDALALGAGIAPGGQQRGFTVRADFLGIGAPGAQPFDIFDPISFALLDSGLTVPARATAVPEPASLWLIALGLLAMGPAARRRRQR